MPEKTQDRFKVLHVLSDKRSKINDEFEKEMKLKTAAYEFIVLRRSKCVHSYYQLESIQNMLIPGILLFLNDLSLPLSDSVSEVE